MCEDEEPLPFSRYRSNFCVNTFVISLLWDWRYWKQKSLSIDSISIDVTNHLF